MQEAYIIAEIGSNCFKYTTEKKNFSCALQQIDAAKACGADAVKFQMFTNKELYGVAMRESEYALPRKWIPDLKKHCTKRRIDFLCSAFSLQGFHHLNVFVDTHKIASPEACDRNLVSSVMCMANPIIVSNGCLEYEEQVQIVDSDLWGADDVMLECVSEYPASPGDYDLSNIVRLAKDYKILWGLSDHTKTYTLAKVARSLGASVFEKHVDLVCASGAATPDTPVSVGRYEFEKYVRAIRQYTPFKYGKKKRESCKRYGRTRAGYRPLSYA